MDDYALPLGIIEQQDDPGDSPKYPSYSSLPDYAMAPLFSYILSITWKKTIA